MTSTIFLGLQKGILQVGRMKWLNFLLTLHYFQTCHVRVTHSIQVRMLFILRFQSSMTDMGVFLRAGLRLTIIP